MRKGERGGWEDREREREEKKRGQNAELPSEPNYYRLSIRDIAHGGKGISAGRTLAR